MHSSPLNPLKPFWKRKVSQIIVACVFWHEIVVNAFRCKGQVTKTLRWHKVIRHALLSNYRLLIAQDSFVSRKPRRISRYRLLCPTFPKTRFKVKYIKELCRANIQTMTCVKGGLQHRASQIRLESRTNCPKHGSRSYATLKPLQCVPNRTIAWNTFGSKTCHKTS